MFRTRDFIIIFSIVAFLIGAIGITIFDSIFEKSYSVSENELVLVDLGNEEKEYLAEISKSTEISREDRLAKMRDKIQEQSDTEIVEILPHIDESEATTSEVEIEENLVTENRCDNYSLFNKPWQASGLRFGLIEGKRTLSRDTVGVSASSSSSSAAITRDIVAILPVQIYALAHNACINSDVIGIAQDGSLIRNNQASLYGIFGPETIVGYALDGFPIYGKSSIGVDECGGILTAGQYKYYLSSERELILNCFSSSPITL